MERYLEGEEISHEETVAALKTGVSDGHVFPVTRGAATRNLGINRLLDAIEEDLPSPARHGVTDLDGVEPSPTPTRTWSLSSSRRSPTPMPAGQPVPRLPATQGVMKHDSQVHNRRVHVKERIGQALPCRAGQGDRARGRDRPGRHRRRREAEGDARDVLAAKDAEIPLKLPPMPRLVMAFAIEAKAKGDEEKMGQALRRLQEDPTIDFHRDPQTGEQILAGITQIHVEVIVERMKERFGAEVELHPPHVPCSARRSAVARRHTLATRSRRAGAASSPTATSRSSRSHPARASSS